jgi:hypothetical protein
MRRCARVHGLGGGAEASSAQPHLDDDERDAVERDEIELGEAKVYVARDDAQAELLEVAHGERLPSGTTCACVAATRCLRSVGHERASTSG